MNDEVAHSGAWGIAVIMIVSWMFYRYLAPKMWREWVSCIGLPCCPWAYFLLARSEEKQVIE